MPRSFDLYQPPAILCDGVVKRFYRYEHRTTTMREFFIRSVLRRPLRVGGADFALVDFDLHVQRGEAVALVGLNGSGKSTALRLIAGVYAPTEGRVETYGRVAAVIELGVGFHPELTGSENVFQYAAVMGLTRREIATRYAAILTFAEIGEFIHEPVKYYSSGMQARLAFAVAICVDPDVLLLDEVLAVGDAWFRERCYERLRGFRAEGRTLVVVSHDLTALRNLCSRAVWMEGGRVRRDGPVEEVLAAYGAGAPMGLDEPSALEDVSGAAAPPPTQAKPSTSTPSA